MSGAVGIGWADFGAMAALLAAVVLRALPRLRWPDWQGTDAYYHLAYIRLIRDTGHRLPRRNPRILGPGEHAYPALFHWLLSFAGAGTVRFMDRFGGLVCDLATALVLAAYLAVVHGLPSAWAGVSAALFVLAPGLILPHIGPRAFTLTPRCWAQLLFALAIVCWLNGLTVPAWFVWSVLPLALMLLTSKFAVQNLVFVAPVAAVLVGRWEPLVASVAAFALAWALFHGMFVRQLKGQLGHLRWYVRHNLDMVAHRRNWRAIAEAVAARDLRRLLEEVAWHNPLTSGLLRHFPLVVALIFAATARNGVELHLATALVLAAVPPWLITAFGRARILGESERYLEFAEPAAWILLWAAAPAAAWPWLAFALAAVFLAGYAATWRFLAESHRHLSDRDATDIVAQFGGEPDAVLLCLSDPESYFFLACSELRLCKYNGDLSAFGELGEFLPWFFWRYPHVHPRHLAEIIARYRVDFVLVNRRGRARLVSESGMDYDLSGLVPIHRNETFELYRVAARQRGAAGT